MNEITKILGANGNALLVLRSKRNKHVYECTSLVVTNERGLLSIHSHRIWWYINNVFSLFVDLPFLSCFLVPKQPISSSLLGCLFSLLLSKATERISLLFICDILCSGRWNRAVPNSSSIENHDLNNLALKENDHARRIRKFKFQNMLASWFIQKANSISESVVKAAGKSEDLPVPDGTTKCPVYPSSLTAAEMSSTNAPIGTQSFTQNMVLRSLFCATISTEIDENGCFIVEPPVVHTGSTVGAVGPLPYLRGQNAHPHGVSPRIFQFPDPRQKPVLASVQPRLQQRLECNLRRPTKATAITPYRLFYLTVKFIQDKSASLILLKLPRKTAGRSEDLPVPDGTIKCPGYPSSLTAAEMSSTNAPIGTQSFTQNMVLRSLFCATISTEIDESRGFIATSISYTGSAVGAVGPLPYLRGQNAHPHGVSLRIFQLPDPRQKPVLASVQPRLQQRLECNLRRPTKATVIIPHGIFYPKLKARFARRTT